MSKKEKIEVKNKKQESIGRAKKKEELKRQARFRNKKLFKYALNLKWPLIVGFIITILASLTELAGPYIISKILDDNLKEGIGAINYKVFAGLVIVYFLSSVLVALIRYIMNLQFAKVANGLALKIREDVFNHVINLPLQFFDKYPAGKIVTRITNDTQDIRLLFQVLLFEVLTTLVFSIGLIIGLFLVSPYLGLITLVFLPFAYLIFSDYKKKSTRYNSDMRRYNSEMNANLNESIQNMEIVQAFNREEDTYREYSDLNDKHNKEGRNIATLWSYSGFNATNTLGSLITGVGVIIFALGFISGNAPISVGGLYIFVDYNRKLYNYINNMSDRIGELEKSKTAADQVFELLEIEKYPVGDKTIDLKGQIDLKDLSFAYDEDLVLKDINISIEPGTSAAFVGHTGSGKSTIMNLIYGFYELERGKLLFDGVDINDLNMPEIRKEMAIVFQNPYIFEGTVYENISLFDKTISKDEAELALINVGGEKILMRDKGIDARVQESGGGFSAGEKQLISFARAMVRNPKILVLDEATSNVDSETEEYIQFGVNRMKKGRTTLIIAHRLSTIKDVDMIYVLDKGRVKEKGSHSQLIAKGGQYADMYKQS